MKPNQRLPLSHVVLALAATGMASALTLLPATPSFAETAAAQPAGLTKVTVVEGIAEYRLANGLRVLLAPEPSKPTTTVNITYMVGSRHENYGETGMAHLLEHLVFKGTPTHANIANELTKRGMRPNGTTWYDRTNYFETFAASDENLEWALKMEADRMVNSFIAKKDLDSEMTVVRNEFEAGENSPWMALFKAMVSTSYSWHNYGKTTIGARSDIENVRIENLQAFYRKYYQPDNAVLVVAGRFDEAKTLKWIAEHFGKIPRPQRELAPTWTVDPVQDGERQVTVRRAGDNQIVGAIYHIPPGAHPDYAAAQILAAVLGNTPDGRLHKKLVETKQAAEVFQFTQPLKEPGFVMLGAALRQEQPLEAVRDGLLATIESVAKSPVTEEEVERARNRALKYIDATINDPERLGVALSEAIAQGDWRLFFLQRDRIEKVTAADVNRVASHFLIPSNRTLGLFVPTSKPERAEVPPAPNVQQLVANYKGKPAVAAGEAFDATPENIERRTTRITLNNGMKLALLPKKTRNETVNLAITLRLGDEQSLTGRDLDGELTAVMLSRGTEKLTRQQIQATMDKLKARWALRGALTSVTASVETTRANLPATMRLLAEVLRTPSFPESEFELLRTERLADLEESLKEPKAVAVDLIESKTNPFPKGHPHYYFKLEEQIEQLKSAKLDRLKAFHRDFYGASHAQMAVVGDFDQAEIKRLTEELFGDWQSRSPYALVPVPYREYRPQELQQLTPDKANAMLIVKHALKLRDSSPDYPALLVGDHILGGGFLNSRLASRIRQKDGLSYGVGSYMSIGPDHEMSVFSGHAIFAPENRARVLQAFREELVRLLKEGITENELRDAKSSLLQTRRLTRAQDGQLTVGLVEQLRLGRTMAFSAEIDKKIEALTVEDVNAALRRHLQPDKLVIATVGDFEKKAVAKK